jgi:AcrR family transcriptional regulator
MTQEVRVLTTKQRRVIKALLSEPSIRRAAKAANVSERQIYRYLSDDFFKSELRRRQDEVITAATAALAGLSGRAIETLQSILDDPEAGASVKARVALGWLKEKREAVELDDLAARVSLLEQKLDDGGIRK